MNNKKYVVNIILAAELGIVSLVLLLMKTFAPGGVLPKMSIPVMVLLSAIPMCIEYYIAPESEKNFFVSVILGAVTFTVLPLCAGVFTEVPAVKMFIVSLVVFGIVSFVYGCMVKRMDENGYKKAAPVVNTVLLFLASFITFGIL
ncbi:MAG: hypothetical protein Q4B67_05555 [Eubacteriales bacterium]|nr:hypothetical protein [Eubacteriales bacterium]